MSGYLFAFVFLLSFGGYFQSSELINHYSGYIFTLNMLEHYKLIKLKLRTSFNLRNKVVI